MAAKKKNPFGTGKSVIISRRRWARGVGSSGHLMELGSNKMCALGFYCRALGVPAKEIRGVAYLRQITFPDVQPLIETDSAVESAITDYNDSEEVTSDRKREAGIRALMLSAGVRVTFVD